jgi:hypothetical protein
MPGQVPSHGYHFIGNNETDAILKVAYEIRANKLDNVLEEMNKESRVAIKHLKDQTTKAKQEKFIEHTRKKSSSKKSSHKKEASKEKKHKKANKHKEVEISQLPRPIEDYFPKKKITYLGIYKVDPEEYVREYGGTLQQTRENNKLSDKRNQLLFSSTPYIRNFVSFTRKDCPVKKEFII